MLILKLDPSPFPKKIKCVLAYPSCDAYIASELCQLNLLKPLTIMFLNSLAFFLLLVTTLTNVHVLDSDDAVGTEYDVYLPMTPKSDWLIFLAQGICPAQPAGHHIYTYTFTVENPEKVLDVQPVRGGYCVLLLVGESDRRLIRLDEDLRVVREEC